MSEKNAELAKQTLLIQHLLYTIQASSYTRYLKKPQELPTMPLFELQRIWDAWPNIYNHQVSCRHLYKADTRLAFSCTHTHGQLATPPPPPTQVVALILMCDSLR